MKTIRLIAAAALLTACADQAPSESTGPQVAQLAKSQLVIGEVMELYGKNFLPEDEGTTKVVFQGTYLTDNGQQEPVNLQVTPIYDGLVTLNGEELQVLRLNRLGPFNNPFSQSDRPGRFTGTVMITTETHDGFERSEGSSDLVFDIGPSVLIDEFQPIDAECGTPAVRALAGIPYRLTVRPVGIKATRFVYQVSNVNDVPGAVEFEHDLGRGNPVGTDTLGVDEAIIFNQIPGEEQFYATGIRVFAYDDDNNVVETALPVSVHRPIEVLYGGKRELAELYEPVPVSGCIPGSINSQVSYSESKTETRQRTVSVTVSSSWTNSEGRSTNRNFTQGVSEGSSRSQSLSGSTTEEERMSEDYGVSYNQSESNNVDFTETDGENWAWNMSEGQTNSQYEERMNEVYGEGSWSGTVGVEASGSVPGFAKVTGSASTTVGVRAGGSVAGTNGASRSRTSERGFNMGGSRSESQSFGSTSTDSRSQSLSGGYALARRSSSTVTDTESLQNTRTWNLSEGVSASDTISEGQEIAEELTLSSTESDQTVQSYSGFIPRGQFGMFYRQTTRWVRRAEVRAYNLCGLARHVGELQFNEYTWAPDLAIGQTCDTAPPPSNLPRANCLVEPCGGG